MDKLSVAREALDPEIEAIVERVTTGFREELRAVMSRTPSPDATIADVIEEHAHGGIRQLFERAIGNELVRSAIGTECKCGWSFAESDEQEVRAEWAAHVAGALAALTPAPQPAEGPRFKIGDMVIPNYDGEPWDPEWIFAIDYHHEWGFSYTTSPCWPPKREGFHVCGLTDEWPESKLSPAAAIREGAV
jgi:hypothetical protein